MLIIASSGCIDENLKLSINSTSAVAKDNFYMEFETAKINQADKTEDVPTYVVIPHELVSIIKGASFVMIKGYKLKYCESNHTHYILSRAAQSAPDDETIDVITGNEILLDIKNEHTLEVDIDKGWKLSWTKDSQPLIKHNGKRVLVFGHDIQAEYEGTPAECYRFSTPKSFGCSASHIPCVRYEE